MDDRCRERRLANSAASHPDDGARSRVRPGETACATKAWIKSLAASTASRLWPMRWRTWRRERREKVCCGSWRDTLREFREPPVMRNLIEHFLPCGSLADVKSLRLVAVFSLLALWLPATSHALLEQVEWIHSSPHDAHDASGTDNSNDHDAADGICHPASNQVGVPQPDSTRPASADFSLTPDPLHEASRAALDGLDPPGAAPPELSQSWQFSFRASLPPRAPALFS